MKKTFTLFAALLLFSMAYAQKDLSLRLTDPNSSSQLYANEATMLIFIIKNTGSVDVLPEDTIRADLQINGAPVKIGLSGTYIQHDTVKPGDSIYVPMAFGFAQWEPDSFLFCVVITTTNNGNVESDTSNNIDCHKLLVMKRTTGVPQFTGDFSIYPNPAADYLVIEDKTGSASALEILDITGRLCLQANITGEPVDVSGLDKGVYACRLLSSGQQVLYTYKLIISR